MNLKIAIDVINGLSKKLDQPFLETLIFCKSNPGSLTRHEQEAFGVVFEAGCQMFMADE